jgi:hypothetical protein
VTAWGIVSTVKAPVAQVMAFIAHHQKLGADRIWLHFDDPDDPAHDLAHRTPGVRAIRCDAAYWEKWVGKRPDKHQNRQGRNVQRVYARAPLPWLAHLDVDEFLLPARPVSDILSEAPEAAPMVRAAPWEALHDPAFTRGAFAARHFRAALKGDGFAALRAAVFGPYAPLLADGVLSHSAGKCFFRTGLARFEPRLHGAFRAGVRVPGGPFHPDLPLLHFHAQDPVAWADRIAFRVERGAYQFNPPLAEFLRKATASEIAAFYDRVQVAHPATLDALRRAGALIEAEL